MLTGMLGRLHHVVLDCPDPASLAAFYSRLLGQPITYQSDDSSPRPGGPPGARYAPCASSGTRYFPLTEPSPVTRL